MEPRQGQDTPMTLQIQPMPIGLQVGPAGTAEHPQTVIVRGWRAGDPARCRLCPTCTANPEAHFCAMVVPGVVHPRDAALFRRTDPGSGGAVRSGLG